MANRANSFSTPVQFSETTSCSSSNNNNSIAISGINRDPITVQPRLLNSAVLSSSSGPGEPPPGSYSVKPVPMPGMGMAAKLGSLSDNNKFSSNHQSIAANAVVVSSYRSTPPTGSANRGVTLPPHLAPQAHLHQTRMCSSSGDSASSDNSNEEASSDDEENEDDDEEDEPLPNNAFSRLAAM